MTPENASAAGKALRAPRAAGVAGIVFSVLLIASLLLVRASIPGSPSAASTDTWITDPLHRNSLLLGLNLIPFAGIAFLWFIGVVRDRIGQREDRFFATVFLGSGLLFVGMLFVSTAVAGGLLASYSSTKASSLSPEVWRLGRGVTYLLLTTYAMRMAAVFMIATATISMYVSFMPRWVSVLGYVLALVLLVTVGTIDEVELLFPVWVFIVSIHVLRAERS
ncbi:MAG: hypothetical protein ACLQUY_19495 [Ktedonobacterales bacterium]